MMTTVTTCPGVAMLCCGRARGPGTGGGSLRSESQNKGDDTEARLLRVHMGPGALEWRMLEEQESPVSPVVGTGKSFTD